MDKMTIPEIIEEVQNEMCKNYCKYPDQYSPEEWESVMDDICGKCPMNRLT